ncbi:MAG TPA: DivIVA domain-containing protein [Acidimicrobiia bacterium]|jgi:cell division initiation protein|nr:DivIVA domain-containing protein [Acidimicrobiia bacterium]
MALLPMEVQQKTFRESMRRGYDQGEVDDFLDEIVASLTEYEGRARAAEGRAAAMEAEVGRLREEREAVTEALVDARRRAQAVIAEARSEADQVLDDANRQARALAEDQVKERERLDTELVGMRSRVSDLRSRLAELATDLDSQVDPLAADLDAAIDAGIEAAVVAGAEAVPTADVGVEVPDSDATEVLDLVDEPLPADQVIVPPDETPEDAAKADAEPDEEDPASIGAVEESLAVWGGGGTRSRPWERGES